MLKKILLCVSIFIFSASSLFSAKVADNDKHGKDKRIVEKIDCPEEMDRNFDDLLQLWANNENGAIECDYNPDEAVVFDDSVYINRLYALPSQMELAYNSTVRQFIDMYANRRRGQVSYMLGLGRYYFPMFEEALDKEGLPLELKYLPVIESALNPIARSRAGATGLWQFMTATGKMYKLEINSLVDERRDPYKSTQAAVKYLKDMYNIYQDWNLVIAAYNCGPGNVNKAIARSGGKRDYWDIYPYLPKETRGYVPAFIAATYIMSYYPQHNICPRETDLPILVDTLEINRSIHFQQIADVLNIPVEDIERLNPQFKENIIPGEYKEYALKLPIHDLSAFIEKEDTIYAHRADELLTHKRIREIASKGNVPSSGGYATYKVKKGDTLGAIAMRHGITVAQLKNWNNMSSDRLSVGHNLRVSAYVAPAKEEVKKKDAPNIENEKATEFVVDNGTLKKATTVTRTVTTTYKVQSGDTWQGIAKKTGSSVADIKKWNRVKGNKLVAGHNLKVQKTEIAEELEEIAKPKELTLSQNLLTWFDSYIKGLDLKEPVITIGMISPTKAPAEDDAIQEDTQAIYHKIVFGETISQIAAKYNVTVSDILSWNNITEKNSSQVTRLLILIPQKGVEKRIVNNKSEEDKDTALI